MTVTVSDGDVAVASRRGRRRLIVWASLLAALVLAADQGTKIAALATLSPGGYIPLLGDVFGLTLAFNPGAAFSFATGSTWVFTLASVIVTVVIVRVSRRLGSLGWALALGALMGGNLGNLTDRLFRAPGFARGHVVDMLNYNGWFIGNVADVGIVAAAIGIALLAFFGIGVDGRRARARDAVAERAPSEDPDDPDAPARESAPDADADAGTGDRGDADSGSDGERTAVRHDATGGDAESTRA